MDTNEKIASIADNATIVAQNHTEFLAACDEERAAEARLLDEVITIVKPALRALSSKLRSARERSWRGNNTYTEDTDTFYAERGTVVVGDGFEEQRGRGDDSGVYVGTDLIVLVDGRFARREWSGRWSRWQGAASIATSELTIYTDTLDVVRDGWKVEDIVASLDKQVHAHVRGNLPKITQAARCRAERLTAIVSLLGVK